MIVKENLYSTDLGYYTASYSLILVFSMLCIVVLGVAFRFYQMNVALKKDAIKLRTSFMTKATNANTSAAANETADYGLDAGKKGKKKGRNSSLSPQSQRMQFAASVRSVEGDSEYKPDDKRKL